MAGQMKVKTEDLFDDLMSKILAESYSGTFADDVCLVGIDVQDHAK